LRKRKRFKDTNATREKIEDAVDTKRRMAKPKEQNEIKDTVVEDLPSI
jgi:hypothetical protein